MVPRAIRSARPQFVGMFDLAEIQACPVRYEILVNVARAPVDVSALAQRLDLGIPLVSRYLGQLQGAGLLTHTKHGKYHIFTLGPAASAVFNDQGLILTMRSDDGQSVQWTLNTQKVAEFLRTSAPAQREPRTSSPLKVIIPRGEDHGARARGPKPPHRANGPGST